MTVKIGKDHFPVSFGFGAIMEYETTTGRPVLALFNEFQTGQAMFTDVVRLIAAGLTNGARKAGKPDVYNVEQVADMLDEADDKMQVITDCMGLLAAAFDSGAKKKTVTMAANRAERRKVG